MRMLAENEPRCLQGRYMLANMTFLVGGDRDFICFLHVINGFQRVYQKQLTNEEKKKYFGHIVKDVNIRDILIKCCYEELEVSEKQTGPEPACMPYVKLRKPIKEIKEYFSRYLGPDLPTTGLRQNNEASTQKTNSRPQKREHAFGERPSSRFSSNSPAYDDQSRDEFGNTLTYSTSPRAPLESPNPFRNNPDRNREVPQRREAFVERPLSRNCGFSSHNNRQPNEFENTPFHSNIPKQPTESTNPFRINHSNGTNEAPQRRVYGFRERPLSRNCGFSNNHRRDEFETAPGFSNTGSIPNDSSFRRDPSGINQFSRSPQAQDTSQFHRTSQPEQLRSVRSAFEPTKQSLLRNEKPTASCNQEDDDSIWDKLENSEKIQRTIRGLLNKLTPSNYEELSQEMCKLRVYESENLLSETVNLVFEKAMEESHFCSLYSDLLCVSLIKEASKSKQPEEEEKQESAENTKLENPTNAPKLIRNSIMRWCQREFESKEREREIQELENELELDESDDAKKKELKERLSIAKNRNKRRAKGINSIIAQLYRHGYVTDSIVLLCASKLFTFYVKSGEEEYMEFLLHFLETIGPTYENKVLKWQNLIKEKIAEAKAKAENCWRRSEPIEIPKVPEMLGNISNVYDQVINNRNRWSPRLRYLAMNLEETEAEIQQKEMERRKQLEKNQMRNENRQDGVSNEKHYQTFRIHNSDSTYGNRAGNIPSSSRSTSMFDLSNDRTSNYDYHYEDPAPDLVDKETSNFERQKQIRDQSRHAESTNVQDYREHSFSTARTANLPMSSQSMVNLHECSNIEENYDDDGRISARNQKVSRMLKEKFSHHSKPALSCINEEDDDSVWNKLAAEPEMTKNTNNVKDEYTKRDEGQYTPVNQSSDSENESLSTNRGKAANRANTNPFNGPSSSTILSDKRGENARIKTPASGGECSSDDDNGENMSDNIDEIIDKTLQFGMKTSRVPINANSNMSEQPPQESLSSRIDTGSVYDVSNRVRQIAPSATRTMSVMSIRSNIPCRRMPIEVTPQRIETLAKIINSMVRYHAPKSIELTTVLDLLERVDTQFEAVFEYSGSTPVDFVDNYCGRITVSTVGDEVFLSWHK